MENPSLQNNQDFRHGILAAALLVIVIGGALNMGIAGSGDNGVQLLGVIFNFPAITTNQQGAVVSTGYGVNFTIPNRLYRTICPNAASPTFCFPIGLTTAGFIQVGIGAANSSSTVGILIAIIYSLSGIPPLNSA